MPADGTAATLQTAVSSPEPGRLIVKVIGYGPHGASKSMQMMVSRFGIAYDPPATFVVRGAGNDSTTASTVSIGSSANYVYSGVDNAGGDPLPAFLVREAGRNRAATCRRSGEVMQIEPGIAVKREERIRLSGRTHRRDRDNRRQQEA